MPDRAPTPVVSTPAVATPRVLLSTGALAGGSNPVDDTRVDRVIGKLAADGLEVMIYGAWYERLAEIAARLVTLPMRIWATHGEKSIGPDLVADDGVNRRRALARFDRNCWFTRTIGGDRIVLHLWGLPDADHRIERQLDDLPRLLDIAERHSVMLAVETIPCVASTPLAVIERVLRRDARARVAIDTEFLGMHDQLDAVFAAEWLWATNAVVHVHVKDYNGAILDANGRRRYLHPGDGTIDFAAWFGALTARGYGAGIALEAPVTGPDGTIDLDRANRSLTTIRGFVNAAWTGRTDRKPNLTATKSP